MWPHHFKFACLLYIIYICKDFFLRCVYCTGTGIELQLPEVPATVLQRVKGSYRYRYRCTVSYSTGDHFQLVVATGQRSKQHLENFASLDLFLLRCIISWNLWGTWLRDTCKHFFRTLAQKRCSLGAGAVALQ